VKQVYCNIQWDKKKGKKTVSFGEVWGKMQKEDANATALITGKGLVVVDVDTKDLSVLDTNFVQLLPKEPTVETKRGYHYYFKVKDSSIFTTKTNVFDKVDIRSDGGLVFNSYWGDNKNISYSQLTHDVNKLPKKLSKYIIQHSRSFEPKDKKPKVDYNNTNTKKMKEILSYIKCYDDYTDWFKVGMALKDWDEVKGLRLWDKWSKQSEAYEEGVCEQKWKTFEKNGNLALGTLYHLASENGYVIEKDTSMSVKKSKNKPLSQVVVKKVKKTDSPFDRLSKFALNDQKIEEMKNQTVLYDSVVVERMHTFIYGKSGANKTTIFGWMAVEILKQFESKKVQVWSFDANADHERSIYNYMKKNNIHSDRMQLLTDSTSDDYYSYYQDIIDHKESLADIVIIIDTFKFISQDVNSKNANKRAMHFIKELLSLGATVVSLGHANKDGLSQSGTAEIEQDSDAILRIDREANTITKEVTVSITSAGRCRFNCQGITFKMMPTGNNYEYLYSSLETLHVVDQFINIAEKVDEEKVENDQKKQFEEKMELQKMKDKKYISVIRNIIKRLTKDPKSNPVKQMIIQIAQAEESMGKILVDRLLRDYNGDCWKADAFVSKTTNGRPTTKYVLK